MSNYHCTECQGRGTVALEPCRACNGTGSSVVALCIATLLCPYCGVALDGGTVADSRHPVPVTCAWTSP